MQSGRVAQDLSIPRMTCDHSAFTHLQNGLRRSGSGASCSDCASDMHCTGRSYAEHSHVAMIERCTTKANTIARQSSPSSSKHAPRSHLQSLVDKGKFRWLQIAKCSLDSICVFTWILARGLINHEISRVQGELHTLRRYIHDLMVFSNSNDVEDQ